MQCTNHRETGEAGVDGAAGTEGVEVPKSRGRSRQALVGLELRGAWGREGWGGVA